MCIHTFSLLHISIHCVSLFFQVYSFGKGSGIGKGSVDARQMSPWLIETLEKELVIDITTGDGHCLALTKSK